MQANQTRDRWDPGWSIYQMSGDGRISVQKCERSRTAVVGEYATNKAPGMPPQTGDQVNLRVHPGSSDMQQGFYYSYGKTLRPGVGNAELLLMASQQLNRPDLRQIAEKEENWYEQKINIRQNLRAGKSIHPFGGNKNWGSCVG